ncbi:phage major capsid protein, P2 family [Oceanisphaera psychrotolerans]|uniref:Phage major capsid protein, P2 family n=1 Tax=Oceanisphaera psychrotolerans TaxID=1414654 RepID=A0A1J4QEW8_9GAMM|nr:phage major capsid protein, P2 family [Oceanisphaera psychrotolerans]OIN09088.1 phage major capsid protein, P2 family [Oceanisphaera psychrotolerans]
MSMILTQAAETQLNKYFQALATGYGIDVSRIKDKFSVTGPQETRLRTALLESVDFLRMITLADVDQIKGQVIDVGIGGIHSGRKANGRFLQAVGVDGHNYELTETDSGAVLPWSTLAVWANAGNEGEFLQKVNEFINRSFALDMLRVGFNGISIAATTDPVTNPLGQDVNKGWQQLAKEWNGGSQIVGDAGSKVYFEPDGKNGEYNTLDAMASDLINSTMDPAFRNDPRLTVLVGADLVAAAQGRLYSQADKPTEQIAAQQLATSIAGRRAMTPPFFPGKRMVVTMPGNLHLYTQRGTRQRSAAQNQDRKGFESQYWRMEGYAVGDYRAYAAFDEDHVVIGPGPDPAA